jgi:hypothetical protein
LELPHDGYRLNLGRKEKNACLPPYILFIALFPTLCFNFLYKVRSSNEVLGSLQLLLPLDFDLQEIFESYLTKEHNGFLSLLRVVEPFVEMLPEGNQHIGRPSYSVLPFLHAALAKRYFKIVATSDLQLRLLSDANLRQICGFENIPSAASFSRYMSYLADNASIE